MSDCPDEAAALRKLLERAPAAGLTDAEVAVLRDVVRAFEGWRALGRATRFLVVTLGLVAAAFAAWDAVVERVRVWLAG